MMYENKYKENAYQWYCEQVGLTFAEWHAIKKIFELTEEEIDELACEFTERHEAESDSLENIRKEGRYMLSPDYCRKYQLIDDPDLWDGEKVLHIIDRTIAVMERDK